MNRVLLFAAIIIFGDNFPISAYNVASEARRSMVNDFLWKGAAMTGVALYHPPEARANEATEESPPVLLESIYVGGGCFWHLQHSVAVFERDTLGRGGGQLTCKTGYAGGKKNDKEGRVCYHNTNNIADYGKLGHGEVVGVDLPSDRIVDATKLYFSQFNPKTKDRVDPMDLGPEYRSLIGLPGGTSHPQYASIVNVAMDAGFALKAGKGSDPDTLGKQLVYVYDTKDFPFYQAEVYHQFHNDFQSLPYGEKYNNLAERALDDGRLHVVQCPDRV